MYSPDMVTGGRLRLADGGMVDISTGDTLDWKHSLWLGSSKVNRVWAPGWVIQFKKNELRGLWG